MCLHGSGLLCINITFVLLSIYGDSEVTLLTSLVDVKLLEQQGRRGTFRRVKFPYMDDSGMKSEEFHSWETRDVDGFWLAVRTKYWIPGFLFWFWQTKWPSIDSIVLGLRRKAQKEKKAITFWKTLNISKIFRIVEKARTYLHHMYYKYKCYIKHLWLHIQKTCLTEGLTFSEIQCF